MTALTALSCLIFDFDFDPILISDSHTNSTAPSFVFLPRLQDFLLDSYTTVQFLTIHRILLLLGLINSAFQFFFDILFFDTIYRLFFSLQYNTNLILLIHWYDVYLSNWTQELSFLVQGYEFGSFGDEQRWFKSSEISLILLLLENHKWSTISGRIETDCLWQLCWPQYWGHQCVGCWCLRCTKIENVCLTKKYTMDPSSMSSILEFKQQHSGFPMNTQQNKCTGFLFELHFTTTLTVIWIYRTIIDPKNWMCLKSLWEFLLVLYWLP